MDELEKIRRVSAALYELYWFDIAEDRVSCYEHAVDLEAELAEAGLKIVKAD